jgi:hypothetical protein
VQCQDVAASYCHECLRVYCITCTAHRLRNSRVYMLTLLYYFMYTLVCAQAALCNIVVQHPPARAVAAAVDTTGALHTILKVYSTYIMYADTKNYNDNTSMILQQAQYTSTY